MPLEKVGARAVLEGVRQYIADAGRVTRATDDIGQKAADSGKGFAIGAKQALSFGAGIAGVNLALQGLAAGFRATVGDSVGAAISFEQSFAGIRKTMDLTEDEFQQLQTTNRALAREIPLSVNEINKIGELAGQLGVRGTANIVNFEKSIARLAFASDVTAEQGALAFAQFANVIGEPIENIDRMVSAVVDLGNNSETTESRIVDMAQRIAGAGRIAKLTAAETFGIAAAFASAGNEAGAGGTAIQNVLIEMTKAVQEGGDALEVFAWTAGMSAEDFSEAFRTDAAGAFTSFVEGIGLSGDKAFEVLERLGLQDSRLVRAFTTTAAAGDSLRRSIEGSTAAYEENTAAATEAEKLAATNFGRIQDLKNTINDLQITIGDAILTGLSPLIDKTREWLDTNGDKFADDMARAIEGGIDFASDLADELDRIVSAVQHIKNNPIGKFTIDIIMSQADKIALAVAAGLAGSVFGVGIPVAIGALAIMMANDLLSGGASDTSARQANAQQRRANEIGVGSSLDEEARRIREAEEAAGRPLTIDERNAITRAVNASRLGRMPGAPMIADPSLIGTGRPGPAGPTGGLFTFGDIPPTRGGREGGPPPPPSTRKSGRSAAEEERDRRREIVRDVQRAREDIREAQLDKLEDFGRLVIRGLERQAAQEIEITRNSVREQVAAVEAGARQRINARRDELRRQIQSINEGRDARLRAIEAELGAIDAARDREEAQDLQRQLALAFDPRDRAEIEKRIRERERTAREADLREQVRNINKAADDQIDEATRRANEDILEIERETEAQLDALQIQLDAAERAYDEMTDEFAIQSRARKMIMGGELDQLVALLDAHVPEWQQAGQSFGESLKDGLESVGLADFVNEALALVEGTQQQAAQQTAEQLEIQARQEQGIAMKEGGAPEFALQYLRDQLIELYGVVPKFRDGGTMHGDGLAMLHDRELVLTPAQQSSLGTQQTIDIDFDFRGAQLTGSIEENESMLRNIVQDSMEREFGREAFLSGIKGR
jgi:TP901 family phage tail tape measure protein